LPHLLLPQLKFGNVGKPKIRAKSYPVKFSRYYIRRLPVWGQQYTGSKISSGTG
jgi:hypothetical protein